MAGLVLPSAGQTDWDVTLNAALLYLASLNSSFGTFGRTTVSNADYVASLNDRVICYTSLTAAHTVSLPDATTLVETYVVVKDESGSAGTDNITVKSINVSQTIDGASTTVINTNYGSKKFYSNGTNWFTSA
jgi:hypothetical protein